MMTTSIPAAQTVPQRIRSSAQEDLPARTEVGQVGWRPVEQELPDAGLSVLICQAGDQDSIEIGAWHDDIGIWCSVFGEPLSAPTHWDHLPEVPLEEVAP